MQISNLQKTNKTSQRKENCHCIICCFLMSAIYYAINLIPFDVILMKLIWSLLTILQRDCFTRSQSVFTISLHSFLHWLLISATFSAATKWLLYISLHVSTTPWACLSVCLFACISQKPHVQTSPIFLCKLPMAVFQSSSGVVQYITYSSLVNGVLQ